MEGNIGGGIVSGALGVATDRREKTAAELAGALRTPQEIARQRAEVMMAFADGKSIESTPKGGDYWMECPEPIWSWNDDDYRVKPQPKTVTLYWYRATKVHAAQNKVGLIEIYDRELNFSLGNPFGMELIKTETIPLD